MKLSLMFIAIVSLVGLSQQQRFLNDQWLSSYSFAPRHQIPSVYLIPGGYVYQQPPQLQQAINYPIDDQLQNDEGGYGQSIDSSYYDNQGRVKAKTFYLWNWLASSLASSRTASTTFTSTAFTTVVQTATIATVQNCLAAAQFANAAAQANPCRRRRRGISTEEIKEQKFIAPTQTEQLEVTSEPELLRQSENSSEITSSQQQEQSSLTWRGGRSIVIVTVTSPTTSFVFATTAIKKNVNLGNAAQLLCLPSGYTVC